MKLLSRFGVDRVRTRLLAAFVILLVAAIALAGVGWLGMRSMQKELAGYEDEVLPGIARALELAERTAQLAAIAPHLADSRTPETLETNAAVVAGLLNDIRRRSLTLPPSGELQPAMSRRLEGVDRDLSNLIMLTKLRQSLDARLERQITTLGQLGTRIHAADRHRSADPAVAELWSSLVLGATTDRAATLGRLQADVEALLIAARRRHALAAFDADFVRDLDALATGPDNILALRRDLLDYERRTNYLVALTRSNADHLSDEVAQHVAKLRHTAAARNDSVQRAIRSGETGLLVLAAVCIAIALGATRYVRRLVGQVENISRVMSGLAHGDTALRMPATRRRDELGELARSFEVFRDNVLAKQQLEAQLQHAQKLDVLGQLTGGVAHDFNNYLGTILGNLSLLEERLADDAQAHAQWKRVQRAAASAAALTRRLLAFARRQPLQAEQVPIDEMIEEMQDLIEYSAGPQVAVKVELKSGPVQVHVDRGQLENALLNLVLNSAAAMPDGGELAVRTRAGAGSVEIEVADTGRGIPEHQQSRVFDPFFTTKAPGEGSGLGLSIVYGFVKQSGGEVSLTSRPRLGTTVVLRFPASTSTPAKPARQEQSAATAPLAGMHLLLVDDDDAFRATLSDMLSRAGLRVTAVASAEQAVSLLERGGSVDVLLSDICLGAGMDGLRLAHLARERWPDLPLGLMSGLSPELLPNAERWDPAFAFVHKPFEPHVLADWLSRLLAEPATP